VIAGVAPHFYIHTNAFACTLRGITDVLTEQGYSFLITPYQVTSSADTPPIPPWLRRGEMDGLITLGVISANLQGFFAEYRETPAYGHRPLVSIDNTMPGYALVRAASDEGGYQLGQHLLELGHRQLLHSFVPNPYTPENGLVLTGLQRACREAGLDPDHALVSFPIPESWRQPPYTLEFHGVAAVMAGELTPAHALFASLAAHPGVTAYCAGNAWAVRAWYLLEHFGWRIPEQLSIVGMSDSDPYPDASGRNLLTSVAVDRREEGREAARLLLRLIADGVQTQETVVVPTTLVIRSSTAPPAPR
jgi:DNA-binding LacI/PurR family transcriptional regulator